MPTHCPQSQLPSLQFLLLLLTCLHVHQNFLAHAAALSLLPLLPLLVLLLALLLDKPQGFGRRCRCQHCLPGLPRVC